MLYAVSQDPAKRLLIIFDTILSPLSWRKFLNHFWIANAPKKAKNQQK